MMTWLVFCLGGDGNSIGILCSSSGIKYGMSVCILLLFQRIYIKCYHNNNNASTTAAAACILPLNSSTIPGLLWCVPLTSPSPLHFLSTWPPQQQCTHCFLTAKSSRNSRREKTIKREMNFTSTVTSYSRANRKHWRSEIGRQSSLNRKCWDRLIIIIIILSLQSGSGSSSTSTFICAYIFKRPHEKRTIPTQQTNDEGISQNCNQ